MAARERHYIITLQRGGNDFRVSTTHGQFFGDEQEDTAFMTVWQGACADNSRDSGLSWTVANTGVLFYSLKDAE